MRTFTLKDTLNGAIEAAALGDIVVFHGSEVNGLKEGEYYLAKMAVLKQATCIACEVTEEVKSALFGELHQFEFVPSRFMKDVKEMRQAQKDYFANRSHEALKKAKKLEAAIDKLLP